ncbi:hypothetical protein JANLI_51250 [Janthinobacterium lividum]|nr:hypothetical protein JANLI_51250 [Janthinobacterium lividum]
MGRASASPSMDTVVAASIMPTINFFNFIPSPKITGLVSYSLNYILMPVCKAAMPAVKL